MGVMIHRPNRRPRALMLSAPVLAAVVLAAQATPPIDAELDRIFRRNEYAAQTFGPAAWLNGGATYTTVEASASGGDAKDLVEYDSASGRRTVLVAASALKPATAAAPLAIDGYAWSEDRTRLLLFTNSKRVWRQNTRGDYWILDRASGSLRKVGSDAPTASLMFAKFSRDASRVAYVRDRDLYVEDVKTGTVTRLTKAENEHIVNGTSDWVYEEELDLRDAFRWSPNGRQIAYWQFDTSGIEPFTLINDTDTLYPTLIRIPYPKAGTTNSAVKIGVVDAKGGPTRWMRAPGDPRNNYLARLEWTVDGESVALQQLNRLQNQNDLLIADAKTGAVRRAYRDGSQTWVDVNDDFVWLEGGRAFLWVSERDGWRHVYRVATDGSGDNRLITRFDGDVISIVRIDPVAGWVYFLASPASATEQFLYRAALNSAGPIERVTPDGQRGFHTYDVSPDLKWAFHTVSRIDVPPVIELVSLPDHRVVRTLVDNAALKAKAAAVMDPPTEFFTVNAGDGATLDGWMITPRGFDASKQYPVLVYVYGEPAGQTVVDRWGGGRGLFHRAIANEGFVVVSIDNRGTPAPKGAAWRKVIYGTVGDLSSREQAAAVRALAARHAFIDPGRVAVWGWSGGGSNTLNTMFRYPDVFSVGVSVAPVPDQRLYDTIYQERYMGLPQENVEGYRVGSPINFAEGLRGRLLVIHGSGDDNVHYQGTERLVNRLVQLGKPFDLMVYPNRSHGISEGEGTTFHVYSKIAHYLLEHVTH
jgi:dipeptidyl-peptidase-4